jgi:hypothetical protein
MKSTTVVWLVAAALCASAAEADAQARHLKLHEINFDMWCQETQHLPPDRCDKRLPQDDAAFQAYVDTIERYETQKLNAEARERRLDRDILYNDPIDNPARPSEPQPVEPPH